MVWGSREHPELKGIPLITSLAKTPEHKQALQLALARLEFGRPFFMPPNVPPARVAAMRRAFDATLKDPEFLAEADKLKLEIIRSTARSPPRCWRRWRRLRPT